MCLKFFIFIVWIIRRPHKTLHTLHRIQLLLWYIFLCVLHPVNRPVNTGWGRGGGGGGVGEGWGRGGGGVGRGGGGVGEGWGRGGGGALEGPQR